MQDFLRLIKLLYIEEKIAYKIIDWIDWDSEEIIRGSETNAKNGKLHSVEELLQIDGVTDEIFRKLEPFITCYSDVITQININTAPKEVLMSLNESITNEIAQRIITRREVEPFRDLSELLKINGMTETIYQEIADKITVKSGVFKVVAFGEDSGVKKIMKFVFEGDKLIFYNET